MPIRRILVAVDYSQTSTRALEYAGALAEQFNAKIEVVHVWDRPQYVPATTHVTHPSGQGRISLAELIAENAERDMQEFLDQCELPRSVHLTHHLVGGEPSAKILECAEQSHQLLVLGTHGRSGVKHLVLGSVAERVVRLCPIPVITVPNYS
ncbi:MAG TPA: universal stress protein [Polyangiaceae bacterium]|nr:universal stress protein [Polyangiaceae bacterium]